MDVQTHRHRLTRAGPAGGTTKPTSATVGVMEHRHTHPETAKHRQGDQVDDGHTKQVSIWCLKHRTHGLRCFGHHIDTCFCWWGSYMHQEPLNDLRTAIFLLEWELSIHPHGRDDEGWTCKHTDIASPELGQLAAQPNQPQPLLG